MSVRYIVFCQVFEQWVAVLGRVFAVEMLTVPAIDLNVVDNVVLEYVTNILSVVSCHRRIMLANEDKHWHF